MFSDITNSIKAKLYDFTYTPFMSSVVISWIILNHKYLLIYFADYALPEKLALLKSYNFSKSLFGFEIPYALNVIFPLVFGLFYVFAYPYISEKFYKFTLEKNKKLKEIKQEIVDKTPLTLEESKNIRDNIIELTAERDKYKEMLIESQERFKIKSENEINTKNEELDIPIKEVESNKSENIQKSENDLNKTLRYLYESNYPGMEEHELLDALYRNQGIPRPKAQKIVKDLIKGSILNVDGYGYLNISDKGNDLLIKTFD